MKNPYRNKRAISFILLLIFVFSLMNFSFLPTQSSAAINYYRGVNLAGPGFASGTYWTGQDQINYYAGKGFDIFRISIKWERIQPTLNGALDSTYLSNLKAEITRLNNAGVKGIIDVHNYGRYNDTIIDSSSAVTRAHFQDLWVKLSNEFKNNSAVYAYDIMNEPHDMGSSDWKAISQAAVTAIRNNGDNKLIMVEGNHWSSASGWENWNLSPAGWITDPANNFLYSAHCYFDSNGSGTYQMTYGEELAANPNLPTIGVKRVMDFLSWCARNNVRGFIGEFGIPDTDIRWNTVLDNFMDALDLYAMDATYWSGGEFPDSYPLCCNPVNGVDNQQMSVLVQHLSGSVNSLPVPTPTPTPDPTLVVYQAEDASVLSNVTVANHYDGFTGTGFADYGGIDAYVEWSNVNAPETDTYTLSFRYASSGARPCTLTVNGTSIGTLAFADTVSWDNWQVESKDVTLNQGNNIVRLTAASGGPNMDKMERTGPPSSNPTPTPTSTPTPTPTTTPTPTPTTTPTPTPTYTEYQAENAPVLSGVTVASTNTGYTGTGYADYGGNGSYVEWNNINAAAGDYTLSFRYASNNSRPCTLTVNGASAGTLAFASTSTWTNWQTEEKTVTLNEGVNTIRITANSSNGGPNLDKMDKPEPGTPTPTPTVTPTPTPTTTPTPAPVITNEAESLTVNAVDPSHTVSSNSRASGGKYDLLNSYGAGDFIEYKINITQTGTYNIKVRIMKYSNNGIYQLTVNGVNQGSAFDSYQTSGYYKDYDLGDFTFTGTGDYLFRFTCTGKNSSASGYKLPTDYILFTLK